MEGTEKKRFLVIGNLFSNEFSFYPWDTNHKYPHYEDIATVNLGIHEFKDLTEAEYWLITNYPFLYMGAQIIEVTYQGYASPNGDALFVPVKDYYAHEYRDASDKIQEILKKDIYKRYFGDQ